MQLNKNPTIGIDPAAVVLERAGVIALREKNVSSDTGSVTVYVDPVALKNSSDLAKIELRTQTTASAVRSASTTSSFN